MMSLVRNPADMLCAGTIGARCAELATGAGGIEPALLSRPVLIIEDEAMIAWMLESLVEDLGFAQVLIAANGPDAIMLARRAAPGLILSDINLGSDEMDGIDATATIVATAPVAVVFISAYADEDAQRRIRRDIPGAPLLRKPALAADLCRAIVAVSRAGRTQ